MFGLYMYWHICHAPCSLLLSRILPISGFESSRYLGQEGDA